MNNPVRVYDFKTKKITEIPAAELAPCMVLACIEGVGEVYIEAAQSKRAASHKHPPLAEYREIFGMIKANVDEVFPKTLEEWEDGFRKDDNPYKEIQLWCYIANAYTACKQRFDLNPDQRRECFTITLSFFTNGRHNALETVSLDRISRPLAESLVEFLTTGGK